MRREPMAVRFWRKVDKREDGCWIWTGSRSLKLKKPYGMFRVNNTKTRRAHILSYEMYHGPVPEGYEIDHLCRQTLCVNPEHLEPVTHAENVRRGVERGSYRQNGRRPTRRSTPGALLIDDPVQIVPDVRQTSPTKTAQAEGYCVNGHRLDEDNVAVRPYGRRCRACAREATARNRAKRRVQPQPLLPCPKVCIHGHAMTPENASPREWGWQCLACNREQQRRTYHARKKALGLTTQPRGPYKKKGQ